VQYRVRARLAPRTDLLYGAAGLAFVCALWVVVTWGGLVKPIFLPPPHGIWMGLADFNRHQWLFPAIGRSTWRVLKSLLCVMAIGIPVGVVMGTFPEADAALRKIVNGVKSIPTTGIVSLIVLWFSIEERAKIVFLVLASLFYMIVLVKNAVLNVSEDYVRVAMDLGATPPQILWRVLLPGALPQIWDAIAVCSGIMWTYIVLAEFINANEEQLGLGYLLYLGDRQQDSGKLFGVLIVIAVISALTDFSLNAVRRRYLRW
jgi:NitT/TauT family transport system permease protein